jgi:hypothetical protein
VSTQKRNRKRVEIAKEQGYRHTPLPEAPEHVIDNLNDPRDSAAHLATLTLHGIIPREKTA